MYNVQVIKNKKIEVDRVKTSQFEIVITSLAHFNTHFRVIESLNFYSL